MSLFRLPKLRSKAASRDDSRNRTRREAGRASRGLKPRRLSVDPLEERTLLSLTPLEPTDTMINPRIDQVQIGAELYTEPGTGSQYPMWIGVPVQSALLGTSPPYGDDRDVLFRGRGGPNPIAWSGQSLAADRDGDFVVTWTRTDDVWKLSINPDGTVNLDVGGNPVYQTVVDPATALTVTDSNVYARYLTDEVQRITLPDQILDNNNPNAYGRFSLRYGGNEVQKLTIAPVYRPFTPLLGQPLINGPIVLGFDVNGNGSIGAGETTTVFFNEANFLSPNALLNPAKVLQTQLQNLGGALSDATVVGLTPHDYLVQFGDASAGLNQPSIQVMSANFTSGFLPAVAVTTEREPTDIPNIPVSPTAPSSTALAISQFFNYYNRFAPTVEVTPVLGLPGYRDGTVFDVRFTGISSKKDVPQLAITAAWDDASPAHSLLGSPGLGVRTLKEPSPQFRVNPEELDNVFTPLPDFFAQSDAAVAMDADGDFVIVWQSEVPDWVTPGSKSDIFARRFTAQAIVDPVDTWTDANLTQVQSVRSLGGQQRVNAFTVDLQYWPAVAMDANGDYAVAWGNMGQSYSFFGGVIAQRYNRDGEKVGGEIQVNTYDTQEHTDPYIALSRAGHMLVVWAEFWPGPPPFGDHHAKLYAPPDPTGRSAVLLDDTQIPIQVQRNSDGALLEANGEDLVAAFNDNNDFVIAWTNMTAGSLDPLVSHGAGYWYGPRALMFRLDGTLIRPTFRINTSSELDNTFQPYNCYPPHRPVYYGDHMGPQIGMDADGDLFGTFDGNAGDLLGTDVDEMFIEANLITMDASGATDRQLGDAALTLESTWSAYRGDSNAVMFSSFDAAAGTGDPLNNIVADEIVPATRDGHNSRYFLDISPLATGGNFRLVLSHPYLGAQTTAAITFDPNLAVTATNIQTALTNLAVSLGGPINVRLVSPFEILQRQGTYWDVSPMLPTDIVFQITFLGNLHDLDVQLMVFSSNLTPAAANPAWLIHHTYGDEGTVQEQTSMAVSPEGSFVAAWMQHERYTDGVVSNTNLYYRQYQEDTDTAGPRVTDFLLPWGQRLRNNAQINRPLQYLVVPFDEEMMQGTSLSSVTNTRNWALMKDGLFIQGGIRNIWFGMNKAADLAGVLPLSPVGTNKWEAVIELDGDGILGGGVVPLPNGHYEVVALESMRDRVGNPLGRTGFTPNGVRFSRSFDLLVPYTQEIRVNADPAGQQLTYEFAAQAVASDPNGDYVAVWRSDEAGAVGIYAKMYQVTWTDTPSGRQSSVALVPAIDPATGLPWPDNEILVTGDPSAEEPAVARDGDGDFVVVWSQLSSDPLEGWDVHARRFTAAGDPLGNPFRVNTETENTQRHAAVAMDVEGDIVVTWQSLGQDLSGYGVYAQRYNPAGNAMGGVNEVQMLTFVGRPTGTFSLEFNGQPTADISISGSTFAAASAIQTALTDIGLYVNVQAVNLTDIVIRFFGSDGSKDQPQILIHGYDFPGQPSASVLASTRLDGTSGEFRVNDTTRNSQMYPSIAMSADGTFVITWTSEGQTGDAPYETNVYVKQFLSNQVLQGSAVVQRVTQNPANGGAYAPLIVTTDSPANHLVNPGQGYDGVAMLLAQTSAGTFMGSGTLLLTGQHVLTAAHVVCDNLGNMITSNVQATFETPTGNVVINSSQIFVDPLYNGSPWGGGHDLAIVVLSQVAPATIQRYDINRLPNEIGQNFLKVGYGVSGQGATGGTLPPGTKRSGQNTYEATNTLFGDYGDELVYDFDDGTAAHDAFGQLYNMPNLGLGNNEASGAPGDSGGPNFIGGLIAGVTSYGYSPAGPQDILPGINFSFGDMGADVRVSTYFNWIDSITGGGSSETIVNQTTIGNQRWSSVAMDEKGEFVVTWTSYGQDGTGGPGPGGEGGYARRFDAKMQPASNEFRVNTFTEGNQQHSRIAMDADGDFVVTWESFQEKPLPPFNDPNVDPDQPDSYGIYAQAYVRTSMLGNPVVGPNGEIRSEMHINGTTEGDQRFPSIATSGPNDFVVMWSGNGEAPGQADPQGIFYQRFENTVDDAGPIVVDTLNVAKDPVRLQLIRENVILAKPATRFVVTFSENLNTVNGVNGLFSIENPNNWGLSRNGNAIFRGVSTVHYGLNQAYAEGLQNTPSNKFEAVITFDSDPYLSGNQELGAGDYVLTVRDTVRDLFDNPLDGNYDGIPGTDFNRKFRIQIGVVGGPGGPGDPQPPTPGTTPDNPVNQSPVGNQDSPAVASDASGNYVVVWVTYGQAGDAPNEGNIMAQRYDQFGVRLGSQFTVNSYFQGNQSQPDIAMDPFGEFIITWAGAGSTDPSGIYAARFDPTGTPLEPEFRVSKLTNYTESRPAVAMDPAGDFVVTWASEGRPDDSKGVYYRRFNSFPLPLTDDLRVNSTTANVQDRPDVGMDANGNYTIIWQSDGQDGVSWGVFGQRYAASGAKIGGEFQVNTHFYSAQYDPQIAMDAAGDYVVVWSSFVQQSGQPDGSGYGVYAQRYSSSGAPAGPEFRVNQGTLYWQYQPAVAMAGNGMFVVTWSTDGQRIDAHDFDIAARIFNADGSDVLDTSTGLPFGEFRVNSIVLGGQVDSAVAMDGDGDFVSVWVGPDANGTGIYSRGVGLNTFTFAVGGGGADPFVGWSGGWSTADHNAPTMQLILGTSGNDQFVFVAGQTPDTWTVRVNGVDRSAIVDLRTAILSFDGRGGYDTVTITGTAGQEKVELWPDRIVLTGGTFSFRTGNIEAINFIGAGGADQAIFHDSPGADTFTFRPDPQPTASLTGSGFALSTTNVATVQASATGGGSDVARLYDSSRTDTFIGSPAYGVMIPSDNSYSVTASGFAAVEAYSSAGGVDTARLYDDRNGNDVFVADSAGGTLSGPAYRLQANGFRYLHATAQGGYDTATLRDSPDVDTFEAYSTYATMSGTAFYARANAFDKVDGESRQGADMARLTGTSQIDRFEARPDYGHLTGPGYDVGAKNFRYVIASGGGGSDTAVLYDSGSTSAADTYIGTTTYGVLYGAAYLNRVNGFPRVEVNAAVGSADQARFYDSPGDDTFSSDPTTAVFNTATAGHTVKNFRYVYGYATAGGNDTATMTGSGGSTGASNFEGRPTYSTLSGTAGSGYYSRVAGFDTVTALSLGNPTDIARLYDSAGNDVFEAYPTYATLTGPGYSSHATGFRYVFAYASDGTDIANFHGSAGDDAFVGRPDYGMLSGAAYLNRANYFDEVHAIAVAGGSDTAKLYDSTGDDYFWARGAAAILSDGTLDNATGALVVRKTYYNTASGFNSVGAYGTTGTNNRKVVTPMDYVLAFTGTWLGDPWP